MQQLVCSIAILAVTVLYCFWRSYLEAGRRRHELLRERVAYLLWVAADPDEGELVAAGADLLDDLPDPD